MVKGAEVIGGICGWCKGGTLENIYVANSNNMYGIADVSTKIGYVSSTNPQSSNLYTYSTTSTGLTSLPSGLSSSIWKMNGATYSSCPDLINNPR